MTSEGKNDKANEAITSRITQLNAVLEKAEKKLREMKLPKDVWYRFSESDPYGPGLEDFVQIGMQNRKGEWMLCYSWGIDAICDDFEIDRYTEWHAKPFRECSMVERVLIVEHLEGLRQRVIDVKEEFVAEIEKAISNATKFVEDN